MRYGPTLQTRRPKIMRRGMASRITKSKERVKKQAEVYTPIHIVEKMIDLMETEQGGEDVWKIGKTWLEPTCGNGVFVGEIVRRKLARCTDGRTALLAMRDVYAIDIMPDNVQQARCQALGQLVFWSVENGIEVNIDEAILIIKTNIIRGDFLKTDRVWIYDWKERRPWSLADIANAKKRT